MKLLQDIALFDSPAYGQDMDFLEHGAENFIANELGRIPTKIFTQKPKTITRKPIVRKGFKVRTPTKKKVDWSGAVTKMRARKAAGLSSIPERASKDLSSDARQMVRRDVENSIANKVKAELLPKLNAIYKMLDIQRVQTEATNEHNVIIGTQEFRRKVLRDLAHIEHQLPDGPLKDKIRARRLSIGLL